MRSSSLVLKVLNKINITYVQSNRRDAVMITGRQDKCG